MISPLPVSPLISSKKVSIIGDVGPVLIKLYQLRRRKECFTQFLPLHLLLKKTLRVLMLLLILLLVESAP